MNRIDFSGRALVPSPVGQVQSTIQAQSLFDQMIANVI